MEKNQKTRAVVLFSGGLDSTVVLASALEQGRECLALSFDYGQRHRVELEAAKKIALHYGVEHRIIRIEPEVFRTDSSSLTGSGAVGKNRTSEEMQNGTVPTTYVPARNTLFIAYAIVQAEIYQADEIYLGPNKLDQIPYPDCRPPFIQFFQSVTNVATKRAVEGSPPLLITPLLDMDKRQIIEWGIQLQAPLELTFSCYDPIESSPCGQCDACRLRAEGWKTLPNS